MGCHRWVSRLDDLVRYPPQHAVQIADGRQLARHRRPGDTIEPEDASGVAEAAPADEVPAVHSAVEPVRLDGSRLQGAVPSALAKNRDGARASSVTLGTTGTAWAST